LINVTVTEVSEEIVPIGYCSNWLLENYFMVTYSSTHKLQACHPNIQRTFLPAPIQTIIITVTFLCCQICSQSKFLQAASSFWTGNVNGLSAIQFPVTRTHSPLTFYPHLPYLLSNKASNIIFYTASSGLIMCLQIYDWYDNVSTFWFSEQIVTFLQPIILLLPVLQSDNISEMAKDSQIMPLTCNGCFSSAEPIISDEKTTQEWTPFGFDELASSRASDERDFASSGICRNSCSRATLTRAWRQKMPKDRLHKEEATRYNNWFEYERNKTTLWFRGSSTHFKIEMTNLSRL